MEPQNSLLWEVSIWDFLIVTVILGGGAAYLTGRALARTWQGDGLLVFYMILLCFAVRFIHFSLYAGTLLQPYYYAIDLVVLLALGFLGKYMTRRRQMARQYRFKFDPASR